MYRSVPEELALLERSLRLLRLALIEVVLIQAIDQFDEPVRDRLLAESERFVEMAQSLPELGLHGAIQQRR
jgi:hypothetical protein